MHRSQYLCLLEPAARLWEYPLPRKPLAQQSHSGRRPGGVHRQADRTVNASIKLDLTTIIRDLPDRQICSVKICAKRRATRSRLEVGQWARWKPG